MTRWALRGLLKTHQWLGSIMCLLTLVWFLSGILMVFFGYPSLTERARLSLLEPLAVHSQDHCFDSSDLRNHGAEVVQRPEGALCVYTIDGRREAHWLRNREGYGPLTEKKALVRAQAVLRRGAGPSEAPLEYRGLLDFSDQWTLSSRYNPYFPLHRVVVEDDANSIFYIAQRTGEVVLITTQRERLLAWFGAIPHWIYPAMLRRARETWRYLVIGLALVALTMSLSGLLLASGLQLRHYRRKGTLDAPFSKRLYRLHYYLGLGSGLFTSTWLLSGAFSLNPLGWSPGSSPSSAQKGAFAGSPENAEGLPISAVIEACRRDRAPQLIRSFYLGGELFYLCMWPGKTEIVSVRDAGSRSFFTRDELHQWFENAFPQVRVTHADWLLESDDYYYPTHYRPDRARLPYLRLALDDEEDSTVYVDAQRGEIALWHTRRSRLERWLYHGLHSLDFGFLYKRPVLWYSVIFTLLGLGILSTGTGVLLGWKFFLRRMRRRSRQRSLPGTGSRSTGGYWTAR